MCCLIIYWEGLRWLNCKVPSPLCSHRQGPLDNHSSLSNRLNTIDAHSWVVGLSSLPAHRIIQAIQSHPCVGTKAPHPLITTKPASHSCSLFPPKASDCSLCSRVQLLCGPAPYAVSSLAGLWVLVTDKLLPISHLPSVRSQAFAHPHKPMVGIPPLPRSEEEVIFKKPRI